MHLDMSSGGELLKREVSRWDICFEVQLGWDPLNVAR